MTVLRAVDLVKHFSLGTGRRAPARMVHAVDGVTFALDDGEILAVVGESGCGKSTVAAMLVGLIAPSAGSITVCGKDLGTRRTGADARLVQLVAQNPRAALNRRYTIRHSLAVPLAAHHIGDGRAARGRMIEAALERVGLNRSHLDQRPADVSGGELARAVLARALLLSPKVLVLDEMTASLDASVKAMVVNLLLDLRDDVGLGMVVITHEIDIARRLADSAAVMYLGRLVETGPAAAVLSRPSHPYTRMLLDSVPVADPTRRQLVAGRGEVPSAVTPPSGCPYHPRCAHAVERCVVERPEPLGVGSVRVACHLAVDLGTPVPRRSELVAAPDADPGAAVGPAPGARA